MIKKIKNDEINNIAGGVQLTNADAILENMADLELFTDFLRIYPSNTPITDFSNLRFNNGLKNVGDLISANEFIIGQGLNVPFPMPVSFNNGQALENFIDYYSYRMGLLSQQTCLGS